MSHPSLTPPPRKLSSSNLPHTTSKTARPNKRPQPRINPTSMVCRDPFPEHDENNDLDLDLALAQLLSQSHIHVNHLHSSRDTPPSVQPTPPSSSTCSPSSLHPNNRTHKSKSDHSNNSAKSLLSLKELVPSIARQRLSYHLDECWFVHFSPDGEYLASIGLDHSIMLWQDLASPNPSIHKTIMFPRTVTHVEWSPDSKYMLVNLGYDQMHPEFKPEFNLIDPKTGTVLLSRAFRIEYRDLKVTGIGWLPDSKRFFSVTEDGGYSVWNLQGALLLEFNTKGGAMYAKSIPGRDSAVAVTRDLAVEIVSLDGKNTPRKIDQLSTMVTSVNISEDASHLALSVKSHPDFGRPAQILLYDLRTAKFLRVFEAETYVNDVFVVQPNFTGPDNDLICAGSENGKLHFWDFKTGELVAVLEEHSQHSGCMTFHPAYPGMMASCSDDNHIILWVTEELNKRLQHGDEKWLHQRKSSLPAIDLKNGW